VDILAEMSEEERELALGQMQAVKETISKLRELSFTIIHSSTKHLPVWRSKCNAAGVRERIMPRDVATRWNSTHNMLEFAVNYSAVIDDMTGGRDNPLRKFELTLAEWRIARDLVKVLKKTMNRYYGKTDESNVYRISMILHPGLKLAYFRQQKWPTDWIENARLITRAEFGDYVRLRAAQSVDEAEIVVSYNCLV
ncbi:hypothetical protein DFH09DRAFT_936571, partial [Mycena vulgaris]